MTADAASPDEQVTASTDASSTAAPDETSDAPEELAQADTATEDETTGFSAEAGDGAEPEADAEEADTSQTLPTEAAEDAGAKDAADPAAIERAEAPQPAGTVDMDTLLQNGSLPEKVLGSEDAPVTIVEYASMTCGHCRAFHEETFPELNKAFIQTGKVRFILREFPLDPRATAAFMLARCSEDKYFPVVDVLFNRQNVWARAEPQDAAKTLFDTVKIAGFTEESFDACLQDQTLLDNVNAVRERASDEFGVDSTPTFFIDGNRYPGAMSIGQLATLIDQAEAE
ncbi:DsbA family protein [Notoacmeibacter ruber]|uniref:DsbA family protein n=2 Tax=Notoacmeibacter ruber TaxID=2670375 RepID=A0A3L7JGU7_9HYPH|nr:DsbA family protein [Notoacmeibacter ruber]